MIGISILHLQALGAPTKDIPVETSAEAVRLWEEYRDSYDLGASDMRRNCGVVKGPDGKKLCTICYNGRVLLPNGSYVDQMTGPQWLTFSRSK